MKIAIIKPILPFPLDQGTRRVTYQVLEALHEGNELTLITRLLSPAEKNLVSGVGKFCSRVVAPLAPNRKSFFHRVYYKILFSLKAIFLLRPMVVSYSCPGNVRRELRRLSKDVEFDILHVEYWYCWPLAKEVRAKVKVLLAHDIDYNVNEKRVACSGAGFLRPISRAKAWCEKRAELKALRECDIILALTEEDKALVRKDLGREAQILPFSGDIERYKSFEQRPEKGSILFLGSFNADFNRDAAVWLVSEIFPIVRNKNPEAKLCLAGSSPTKKILSLSGNGIAVAGDVEDVGGYFVTAELFALPLRFGGGLRVRLIEAMAAGMAVVTTPVGRSGVPGKNGVHFLVRESAADFAAGVAMLLENKPMRDGIGRNARELTFSRYGGKQASTTVRDLYRNLWESAGKQQSHSRDGAPSGA